jgi:hypothetical protein
MFVLFAAVCLCVLSVACADDVILSPSPLKKGPVSVIYFAQGADIETEQYRKIMTSLQEAVDFPLWVGIAQSPMNTAPIGLSAVMGKLSKKMEALGMKAEYTFQSGHSLGGAMTPDYVAGALQEAPGSIDAMVLMASFMTRKFKTGATPEGRPQVEFPVPSLTVSGELDGLCRLTRIAEALYTQVSFAADPAAATLYMPVTVVPGMNHMEFASGEAPEFVKQSDLQAEVTEDEAQAAAVKDIAAFMGSIVYPGRTEYASFLAQRVAESVRFVQPIVDSLLMEGYEQFLPACYCETLDEYGYPRFGTCVSTPACNGGVRWTQEFSQPLMGGLADRGVSLAVADSIHRVTETDPDCHHPHLHGAQGDDTANAGDGTTPPICPTPDGSCTLNITTVTEPVYHSGGEVDIWRIHYQPKNLDTGYLPIAAAELRTKLKSRQSIWNAAGILDANYTELDLDLEGCMEINQAAIDWALATVSETTRARYEQYGQKLTVVQDTGTCAAGPCWIWDRLKFTRDNEANSATVQSVYLAEPNENLFPCGEQKKIPCTAGFHYCKVLSPARAVEWMYVDGLRNKLGTKNL